eukprot:GHVU01030414.1.p1 GENE.GHVU01030414.1~~GHVU01030414.1.p1  ORF type:complete len:140 (-),score=3.90 GHVU01030414.1:79-498(-)
MHVCEVRTVSPPAHSFSAFWLLMFLCLFRLCATAIRAEGFSPAVPKGPPNSGTGPIDRNTTPLAFSDAKLVSVETSCLMIPDYVVSPAARLAPPDSHRSLAVSLPPALAPRGQVLRPHSKEHAHTHTCASTHAHVYNAE